MASTFQYNRVPPHPQAQPPSPSVRLCQAIESRLDTNTDRQEVDDSSKRTNTGEREEHTRSKKVKCNFGFLYEGYPTISKNAEGNGYVHMQAVRVLIQRRLNAAGTCKKSM
jgi:hypothetical protein